MYTEQHGKKKKLCSSVKSVSNFKNFSHPSFPKEHPARDSGRCRDYARASLRSPRRGGVGVIRRVGR